MLLFLSSFKINVLPTSKGLNRVVKSWIKWVTLHASAGWCALPHSQHDLGMADQCILKSCHLISLADAVKISTVKSEERHCGNKMARLNYKCYHMLSCLYSMKEACQMLASTAIFLQILWISRISGISYYISCVFLLHQEIEYVSNNCFSFVIWSDLEKC